MKNIFACCVLAMACSSVYAADKPNILFIAIDDQNDWIGHLDGHPLAKTPHIDALAKRGTTFTNAHCQAPLCNPSRTSLLLGLRPTTTGIYGLKPWFRTVPEWSDRVTLPQHFANDGYYTAATGKIYHGFRKNPKKKNQGNNAPEHVEFEVTGAFGGVGTKPPKKLIPETPMGNHPLMDWGVWPLDNDDTQKGDYQVASWTVEQIQNAPKDRPFFLAAGFFLHDIGKSKIPSTILNKKSSLSPVQWEIMKKHPEEGCKILEKFGEVSEEIKIIVLQHHERHDGNGYPRGLKEDQINMYAKICSISDVFDALTSYRKYKEKLSTFDALKIIKNEMNNNFDPDFFEKFARLFC